MNVRPPRSPEGDPIAEAKARLFPPLKNKALAQAANDIGAGRMDNAQELLSRHLTKHPRDADALNMMADIERRRDRFEAAEALMRRCLEAAPHHAGYRFNHAVLLRRLERFDEALALVDELLNSDPGNTLFREQQAKTLWDVGRVADALRYRRELAEENPRVPAFWMNYGDTLRGAGDRDACIAAFRRALELDPSLAEIYLRLANLKTYRFSADELARMEGLLTKPSLSADARAGVHFALGRAYGQHEAYAKSFEHYSKGNALRRLALGADSDRLTTHRQDCEALFTREFLIQRSGWGTPSPDPIFILCLPRSGSTLLEQILSSHSAVEALGEPSYLDTIVRNRLAGQQDDLVDTGQFDPFRNYARMIREASAEDFRSMGDEYLRLAGARRKTGSPFFTDKTVFNFLHLGLLHLVLPNARIVDVRRHPLDCGWSCFTNHFPQGVRFSYRLPDIGRYYANYVRLMAHFDRVLPGKVHRVFYEDVVAEPEKEIRELLAHVGLPFEEQCLRFYENNRPVNTVSSQQVRQPLYKEGIAQWRPYEQWLGPLKASLGPVLACYPGVPE